MTQKGWRAPPSLKMMKKMIPVQWQIEIYGPHRYRSLFPRFNKFPCFIFMAWGDCNNFKFFRHKLETYNIILALINGKKINLKEFVPLLAIYFFIFMPLLVSVISQGSSMNRIAASAKLFDILEYICHLHRLPLAVTWISHGQDGNTNSKGKRILCIDDSACYVNHWFMEGLVDEYARLRLEEGQGIAGKALQSNIHIQHGISVLDPAEIPRARNFINWWVRNHHAAFAIRLTSTHPCKDDYVLEFLLPTCMKKASELVLLINKVLRTLQRKCLKLWKVWVRELNEASGSEVRLDDERMPNIPHEETREPLEQVLFYTEFMSFFS